MSESLPHSQDNRLNARPHARDERRRPTPLPGRAQIRQLAVTHRVQVQHAVTKGRITEHITLEHMDALKDLADTLDPDDAHAFLNMYTEERSATAFLLQESARLKAKAAQRERFTHIAIAIAASAFALLGFLYWT